MDTFTGQYELILDVSLGDYSLPGWKKGQNKDAMLSYNLWETDSNRNKFEVKYAGF